MVNFFFYFKSFYNKLNFIDSSLNIEYIPSSSEIIVPNTPILINDSMVIPELEEEYEKVIIFLLKYFNNIKF